MLLLVLEPVSVQCLCEAAVPWGPASTLLRLPRASFTSSMAGSASGDGLLFAGSVPMVSPVWLPARTVAYWLFFNMVSFLGGGCWGSNAGPFLLLGVYSATELCPPAWSQPFLPSA